MLKVLLWLSWILEAEEHEDVFFESSVCVKLEMDVELHHDTYWD